MAEMSADPAFRRRDAERLGGQKKYAREFRTAEVPVMKALRAAGITVEGLDDLRTSGTEYRHAVPVLVEWMEKAAHPGVREAIVRALSVPWADGAVPALLREFVKPGLDADYRWVIGNALAATANAEAFVELSRLAADARFGRAREMLVVALGNTGDARALGPLLELLKDRELCGYALMGLARLGMPEACTAIVPLLSDSDAWVRQEARCALRRLKGKGK